MKKIVIMYRIIIILLISFILFMVIKNSEKEIINITNITNPNYVFLGDSITDFYDLKKYYGDNIPIVNSGVNGNITSDILNDLENRVYRYNPSKVIILIGVNDIQRGIGINQTISNIDKIVYNIKKNKPNCIIYLESVYPINNTNSDKIDHNMVGIRTNDQIKVLNKKIKEVSKKQGVNYIDMYSYLVDNDGNLNIEYTEEGLHISDEGYRVITDIIKKIIF